MVEEIALTLTVRRSKSAYEVDALLAILKGAADAAGASLRICSGSVKEAVATFYLVISNKNTYIPNNTGVAIPTPITTFG